MTYQEALAEWIHRVELSRNRREGGWNREFNKRLYSLITEYFFSLHLKSINDINLPQTVIHGWMYQGSYHEKPRRWFKLSENTPASDPRKKANEAFIRHIKSKRPEDRFFILKSQILPNKDLITIEFDFQEILIDSENRLYRRRNEACRNYRASTKQSISKNLDSLAAIDIKQIPGSIDLWLNNISESELEIILATRCLMNFGLQYATDIDALVYSENDLLNPIKIIEYKRKYPTSGSRRVPLLISEENKLKKYLGLFNDKNSLSDFLSWEKKTDSCFGLDRSHASNASFCLNNNIDYIYLIWNSRETSLEELITHDFFIKDRVFDNSNINYLNLKDHHFDGFSRTDGKDSGSLTEDTRFQLMIKEVDFQKTCWESRLRANQL
ncbi:hypothetical protein D3C78_56590 [compost metagenome]